MPYYPHPSRFSPLLRPLLSPSLRPRIPPTPQPPSPNLPAIAAMRAAMVSASPRSAPLHALLLTRGRWTRGDRWREGIGWSESSAFRSRSILSRISLPTPVSPPSASSLAFSSSRSPSLRSPSSPFPTAPASVSTRASAPADTAAVAASASASSAAISHARPPSPPLYTPYGVRFVHSRRRRKHKARAAGATSSSASSSPKASSSSKLPPSSKPSSFATLSHGKRKLSAAKEREVIEWYRGHMERCKKLSARELVKNLDYSNLLGANPKFKNGKMTENGVNTLILKTKQQFPHEVVLCRVGEFYETVGFDACLLVEHAGLNPMGGVKPETVPRAGCPTQNLTQTLDSLTSHGLSAAILEEALDTAPAGGRAGSTGNKRKQRFLGGHAHPGSPYVYGFARHNIEIEFPEQQPILGIARTSATGYTVVSVWEMIFSYSVDTRLTEEAAVAKLRASGCHRCFVHSSVTGGGGWREQGAGGMLFSECAAKGYDKYEGDPVKSLLNKVRELYDLGTAPPFQQLLLPPPESRPRPLYVSTASQIGILPTQGVPSLPHRLLPDNAAGLSVCLAYLRSLLLHPPPPEVATSIQDACRRMFHLPVLPEFLCVPPSRLVKLISAEEATSTELLRVGALAQTFLDMLQDSSIASSSSSGGSSDSGDGGSSSSSSSGGSSGGSGGSGGGSGGISSSVAREGGLRQLAMDLLVPTQLACGLPLRVDTLAQDCEAVCALVNNVLLSDTAAAGGAGGAAAVAGKGVVEGEEEEEKEEEGEKAGKGYVMPPPLNVRRILEQRQAQERQETGGKLGEGEEERGKGSEEEEGEGDRGKAVSESEYEDMASFFEDMEGRWRGRVRYEHIKEECDRVARAAERYNEVVRRELMPFVNRSRNLSWKTSKASSKSVEIVAFRDHGVLLKGRIAKKLASPDDPVDPLHELSRLLEPAVDGKGKKMSDGWYSTPAVDEALIEYKEAVVAAHAAVVAALQQLSRDLQLYLRSIVAVANFGIVARTLDEHVRCCSHRGWIFPTLAPSLPPDNFPTSTTPPPSTASPPSATSPPTTSTPPSTISPHTLLLEDLIPYWLDHTVASPAVPNTLSLSSLALLTGPNGGGKSSLLRSVCAAALLASSGLMVPCLRAAHVPRFDSIVLRMMPADSPSDAKSSFQMEMMELRSITQDATPRSLVLLDELCKGTEPDKGACLVASALEFLDQSRCVGVLSTHFHRVLDLPLQLDRVVRLAMGVRRHEGEDGGMEPTWKVTEGECRDSLAFEVAVGEGVPAAVVDRAAVLLQHLQQQEAQLRHAHDLLVQQQQLDEGEKSGRDLGLGDTSVGGTGNGNGAAVATPVSALNSGGDRSSSDLGGGGKEVSAVGGDVSEGRGGLEEEEEAEGGSEGEEGEVEEEEVDGRIITRKRLRKNSGNSGGGGGALITSMALHDAVRLFEVTAADLMGRLQGRGVEQEGGASGSVLNNTAVAVCGDGQDMASQQHSGQDTGLSTQRVHSPLGSMGALGAGEAAVRGVGDGGVGVRAVVVMAGQMPSASVANHRSFVYLLCRPDGKFYVGETDQIVERIRQHRNSKLRESPVAIIPAPSKSAARFIETHLITRLRDAGMPLVNKADQKHRHFGSVGLLPPPF
ncbi:hypothetical protein CLOP_g20566 [Closterium sp. NIES-67]|nr:hypothetical protein CLOP_g20566 [Closterium sp. NIES-67]